jgi:uncharacterized protein involved in outer membrane biogenesis
MTEPAKKATVPRRRRRLLWAVPLVVVLFVLGAPLIAFVFHLPIDLSRWNDRITAPISEALGRPLTVERLIVRFGRVTTLRVEGLSLASDRGGAGAALARIGTGSAQFSLLPLLDRELVLQEIRVADLGVDLQALAQEEVESLPAEHATAKQQAAPPDDGASAFSFRLAPRASLSIEGADIAYAGPVGDERRHLLLEAVELIAGPGAPTTAQLQGSLGGESVLVNLSAPPLDVLPPSDPWPISARLEAAGLELELDTDLTTLGDEKPLVVDFDVSVAELSAPAALLGLELPASDRLEARGRIAWQHDLLIVSPLAITTNLASATADLELELASQPLRLSGEITIPTLSLPPPDAAAAAPDTPAPDDQASVIEDWEAIADLDLDLPSDALASMIGELSLSIGAIEGAPVELSDIETVASLADSRLGIEAVGRVEGHPFDAHVSLESDSGVPSGEVRLELSSTSGSLPASFLPDGWTASVDSLNLHLASAGGTPARLLSQAHIEASVTGIGLGFSVAGRRHELSLQGASIRQIPSDLLRIDLTGDLDGEPLDIGVEAPALSDWLARQSRQATLTTSVASARAKTTVSWGFGGELPWSAEIAGEGPRAGELASILGLPRHDTLPFSFAAGWTRDELGTHLDLRELQVGRSHLSGQIERPPRGDRQSLSVRIESRGLDLGELRHSFGPRDDEPEPTPVVDADSPSEAIVDLLALWDRPIESLDFVSMPIELDARIDRLFRRTVDLEDLRLHLRLDECSLRDSELSLKAAGAMLAGELDLRLCEGPDAEVRLRADAEGLDLGHWLAQEEIAERLDLDIERAELRIETRAATIGELLSAAELTATAQDGVWLLREPAGGSEHIIELGSIELRAAPGHGITMQAGTEIQGTPVALELSAGAVFDGRRGINETLPFSLRLTSEPASLLVEGEVELPLSEGDLDLSARIEGERLRDLESMLFVELPPLYDYRASARLAREGNVYRLSGLQLETGESHLEGEVSFDLAAEPQRLDVAIRSDRLQLADFMEIEPAQPEPEQDQEQEREREQSKQPDRSEESEPEAAGDPVELEDLGIEVEPLITPRRLRSLDANLDIDAESLRVGERNVGAVSVAARLKDGRLELGPLEIESGDVKGRLSMVMEADGEEIEIEIDTDIDRLDYTELAKMADAEAGGGVASVRASLRSRAPSFQRVLEQATGQLAFVLFPRDFQSRLLDLWGAGLLNSVMPVVGWASSPSTVNCIGASFELEDGLATSRGIMLDTTRVRVRGKGEIDFGNGQISLVLKPKPKQRSFVSLATPVKIEGPLDDPEVGFSGGIVGSFARFSSRVFLWWLQLTKKPLPEDGRQDCWDLYYGGSELAPPLPPSTDEAP